jgi:tetratricopeptide (TPR) repeat protein
MKRIIFLSVLAVFAVACGNEPQTTQEKPTTNVNVAVEQSDNTLTVSSHSQEGSEKVEVPTQPDDASAEKPTEKSKWRQSGTPIDTSEFDAAIAEAEKNLKSEPNDEAAKKALSEAYYKRAFALTQAQQYASALGDYRRALKNDANNADAKASMDQILSIYKSLNREYPGEGEEPPPLPFDKAKKS